MTVTGEQSGLTYLPQSNLKNSLLLKLESKNAATRTQEHLHYMHLSPYKSSRKPQTLLLKF